MSRQGRLPALVVLLTLFALPLSAQPRRTEPEGFRGTLARIWHEVTAPFLAIWGADDATPTWDPNGGTKP